ncbi:hypothetical protein AVEN_257949-1, partial [Araneus ventricosus]
MRSRRISKRGLASPGGTVMVGVELPPSSDSRGRGRCWLLGLRSRYSSYCSDCHSVFPSVKAGLG